MKAIRSTGKHPEGLGSTAKYLKALGSTRKHLGVLGRNPKEGNHWEALGRTKKH